MSSLTLIDAMALGLVEGITEFVPVSSTGHLILAGSLLNFQGPPGHFFEVVIQLGAILAVCWLYRNKLWKTIFGIMGSLESRRFAFILIVGFFPAAISGVLFHSIIKSVLFSTVTVSISLIIGGFIIIVVERLPLTVHVKSLETLGPGRALLIGMYQSLALIPGVSRSGATILGGLLSGVDRRTATEFSFLLAIPTILGATVWDTYKNIDSINAASFSLISVGFIFSFLSALIVIRYLTNLIVKHGLTPFAWYRIAIGLITLYLHGLGLI